MVVPMVTSAALWVGGEVVGTMLGREVVTAAIRDTSSGIYESIRGMAIDNHPLLQQTFSDMDIHATVERVESLVQTIEESKVHEKPPVEICLKQVHDSLSNIHKDLDSIQAEVDRFNQIWFQSVRGVYYHNDVDRLKTHAKTLNKRMNGLTQSLKNMANLQNLQN